MRGSLRRTNKAGRPELRAVRAAALGHRCKCLVRVNPRFNALSCLQKYFSSGKVELWSRSRTARRGTIVVAKHGLSLSTQTIQVKSTAWQVMDKMRLSKHDMLCFRHSPMTGTLWVVRRVQAVLQRNPAGL